MVEYFPFLTFRRTSNAWTFTNTDLWVTTGRVGGLIGKSVHNQNKTSTGKPNSANIICQCRILSLLMILIVQHQQMRKKNVYWWCWIVSPKIQKRIHTHKCYDTTTAPASSRKQAYAYWSCNLFALIYGSKMENALFEVVNVVK